MTLYLIINGYYDNWEAVCYTDSKEEAERFCEVQNSKIKEPFWEGQWYYREIYPVSKYDGETLLRRGLVEDKTPIAVHVDEAIEDDKDNYKSVSLFWKQES